MAFWKQEKTSLARCWEQSGRVVRNELEMKERARLAWPYRPRIVFPSFMPWIRAGATPQAMGGCYVLSLKHEPQIHRVEDWLVGGGTIIGGHVAWLDGRGGSFRCGDDVSSPLCFLTYQCNKLLSHTFCSRGSAEHAYLSVLFSPWWAETLSQNNSSFP